MRSVRFFHKLETTFLYKKAAWISQTNSHRLDFFSKDHPYVPKSILFSLANYPPISWAKSLKKRSKIKGPIKLLYIGALSFENTYIREIVTFVRNNPNSIKLDIFSYNMHNDVLSWLQSESIENISLNAFGIPYDQIPKIASSYDIGLVLYKGHNINYQYNAPNKLFEYLEKSVIKPLEKNEFFQISPFGIEKTFSKNLLKSDFSNKSDMPEQVRVLYAPINRDGVERETAYAGEVQYFKQGAYNQTNGKKPEDNIVWSTDSETFDGDISKQYANGCYTEVWFKEGSLGPGTSPDTE